MRPPLRLLASALQRLGAEALVRDATGLATYESRQVIRLPQAEWEMGSTTGGGLAGPEVDHLGHQARAERPNHSYNG